MKIMCAIGMLIFAASAFSQIPANAVSSGNLDAFSGWTWTHDRGTPGSSVGSSSYPVSNPALDGQAREFSVAYYDHGGERYHLSLGQNTAYHFVYDTYVYVEDPSQLANLEMDLNQVLPNGATVFIATQCSGYSKTWEYTYVSSGGNHWHTSNISCNPKAWTAKTWHHVQIAEHIDSSGVVTHDWIGFDGKISYFQNAVGYSAKYLGWQKGDLVLNVQPDGASSSSGSIKLYFDKLQVFKW